MKLEGCLHLTTLLLSAEQSHKYMRESDEPQQENSMEKWYTPVGWNGEEFFNRKWLWNWMIIRLKSQNVFPKIVRSIKLIDGWKWPDKLPYSCHSNPITDHCIPDCRRLCPFHEHFVVGLQELHFLNRNVIFKQIFHLDLQKEKDFSFYSMFVW